MPSDPFNIAVFDNIPDWIVPPTRKFAEEGSSGFGPALSSGLHTPYMSQSRISNGVLYAANSHYVPGDREVPFLVASPISSCRTVNVAGGGSQSWPTESYYITFAYDLVSTMGDIYPPTYATGYEQWSRVFNHNFMLPLQVGTEPLTAGGGTGGIGSNLMMLQWFPVRSTSVYADDFIYHSRTDVEGYFYVIQEYAPIFASAVTNPDVLASNDYAQRSQYTNCQQIQYAPVGPRRGALRWTSSYYTALSAPGYWGSCPLGKRASGHYLGYYRRGSSSWYHHYSFRHLNDGEYGVPADVNPFPRRTYLEGSTFYTRSGVNAWYVDEPSNSYINSWTIGYSPTLNYSQVGVGDRWWEEPYTGDTRGQNTFAKEQMFGNNSARNTWADSRTDRAYVGGFGWDKMRKKQFPDREEYVVANEFLQEGGDPDPEGYPSVDREEVFYTDTTYTRNNGDYRVFDTTPVTDDGDFLATTYLVNQANLEAGSAPYFTEELYWTGTSGSIIAVGSLQSGGSGEDAESPLPVKYKKYRHFVHKAIDEEIEGPRTTLTPFGSYNYTYCSKHPSFITNGSDLMIYIYRDDWLDGSNVWSDGNGTQSIYTIFSHGTFGIAPYRASAYPWASEDGIRLESVGYADIPAEEALDPKNYNGHRVYDYWPMSRFPLIEGRQKGFWFRAHWPEYQTPRLYYSTDPVWEENPNWISAGSPVALDALTYSGSRWNLFEDGITRQYHSNYAFSYSRYSFVTTDRQQNMTCRFKAKDGSGQIITDWAAYKDYYYRLPEEKRAGINTSTSGINFLSPDGRFYETGGIFGASCELNMYDRDINHEETPPENWFTYDPYGYSGLAVMNSNYGFRTTMNHRWNTVDLCVGVYIGDVLHYRNHYVPLASVPGVFDFWADQGVLYYSANTINGSGTLSKPMQFGPQINRPDVVNVLEASLDPSNYAHDAYTNNAVIWLRVRHRGAGGILLSGQNVYESRFDAGGYKGISDYPYQAGLVEVSDEQVYGSSDSQYNAHTRTGGFIDPSPGVDYSYSVLNHSTEPTTLIVGVANGVSNPLFPIFQCWMGTDWYPTDGSYYYSGVGADSGLSSPNVQRQVGFHLGHEHVDRLGADEWSGFSGTNPTTFTEQLTGDVWTRDASNTVHWTQGVKQIYTKY